ncbi:hypothetical protein EAJ18_09005 [Citrobacter amalonaticus]|uniref:Uncharacterized protein n=1 Tax=Citrobacter amalonaticus TaxID=35703 RepID=A0ABY0HWG0_CITAM|nr:hypothetical protein AL524_24290 [Citrobacter amalonaticus]PNP34114.1 hypothetical protein AL525_009725 [Citrobacter amalonaticus]RYT44456.1 hypothetical protein EAJ18_09005 [Citrobacter amalonaticus]
MFLPERAGVRGYLLLPHPNPLHKGEDWVGPISAMSPGLGVYLRPASSASTSSTLVVLARRSMTDSSSSALVRLVIT